MKAMAEDLPEASEEDDAVLQRLQVRRDGCLGGFRSDGCWGG